jgi:DNA-binding CsgD family transcriptional regulator
MTTLHSPSLFNGEKPLTPCELQVCYELVKTTLGQKEIAAKLGKSVKTVNLQATSAYKKLGVTSRFELIQRFGKTKEVQVSHLSSSDVVHRLMQRLEEVESKLNALLAERRHRQPGSQKQGITPRIHSAATERPFYKDGPVLPPLTRS